MPPPGAFSLGVQVDNSWSATACQDDNHLNISKHLTREKDMYYDLFTYTGLGFCVLIALSWGISTLDKNDG